MRQEEIVPSSIESVPTTASGTSDLRVQTTLMRIDDPPRPTPRLRAPVLTEPVRHLVPPPARNEGTLINGRPYEAAIEVTPPGPLVLNPDIPIPPQVERALESDDPYNLDESNEDEDEEEDEDGGDEARPTPLATTSPHP